MCVNYSKNSQREQDRQKRLDPIRKWLYNKRYYQKSKESVPTVKNYDVQKKILKKYRKFRSQNIIKLHSSKVYIQNIAKKLSITDHIEKRLKAEKIVRWCMYVRKSYIRNVYKILTLIRQKAEVNLTELNLIFAENSTNEDKIAVLCGIHIQPHRKII